jgi:two-component system sensor histidine kinase EvgS
MIDTIGFSDAPANGMLFKALGGFEKFQPIQMTFRYEDLSENKVDAVVAYVTDQPFKFQEVGVDVNILDPRDYGIDFYGDNLFTTEQEIREYPQIWWNGPGTYYQQTAGQYDGRRDLGG